MTTTIPTPIRRYDIDWIRSLAFIVLILYHVGMYYVADWGWHVKSPSQSTLLQDVMIITNPWRMSLLFFVSGMTMALLQGRYSGVSLLAIRTQRIMIPLLFGMLVVVPPQLYFELTQSSVFSGSYWAFLQEYYNLDTQLAPHKQSEIGLITWNHLWFLPYLWCYTLLMLLFSPLLKQFFELGFVRRAGGWSFIAVVLLCFAIVRVQLRADYPVTHGLFDDWYNHGRYLLAMLSGYALVSMPNVWQLAIQHRFRLLLTGVLIYSFFIADRHLLIPYFPDLYKQYEGVRAVYAVVVGANTLAWIGACVGYAGRYLNRDSKLLRYLNTAILPCYILHQTVIILLAMLASYLGIPVALEVVFLIFGTLGICLVAYELIRRVTLLRLAFGLKLKKKASSKHCNASMSSEAG